MFARLTQAITPVETSLADTGVAFVPMLVAAAVALLIVGLVVLVARYRLSHTHS
ncbi:hypothetical protein [Agreia sp. COWG]|uniref:hypothetical protein n=1 Tax=Agreia sp. COWG TaxID=2773266 RepID=UPI001AF0609A|nr:hypothetical protein [Agreia sp. COWG]CAD6001261.1 protein of unknown function [Agreia sp. COWG]